MLTRVNLHLKNPILLTANKIKGNQLSSLTGMHSALGPVQEHFFVHLQFLVAFPDKIHPAGQDLVQAVFCPFTISQVQITFFGKSPDSISPSVNSVSTFKVLLKQFTIPKGVAVVN